MITTDYYCASKEYCYYVDENVERFLVAGSYRTLPSFSFLVVPFCCRFAVEDTLFTLVSSDLLLVFFF